MKSMYVIMGLLAIMAVAVLGIGPVSASDCKTCDSTLTANSDNSSSVVSGAAILSASVGSAGLNLWRCRTVYTTYCCASRNGRCIKVCSRKSTVCA
jgi:hypothetical protein